MNNTNTNTSKEWMTSSAEIQQTSGSLQWSMQSNNASFRDSLVCNSRENLLEQLVLTWETPRHQSESPLWDRWAEQSGSCSLTPCRECFRRIHEQDLFTKTNIWKGISDTVPSSLGVFRHSVNCENSWSFIKVALCACTNHRFTQQTWIKHQKIL